MTAPMISFSAAGWRFHLRAAAIIRDGDFVLLHRVADDPFWALPGGRVELGETAEDAVRRELREELDTEVQVSALAAVVENRFRYRGESQHGVELHFEVTLPPDSPLLGREPFERMEPLAAGLDGQGAGSLRMLFQWFHLSEVPHLDLRPAFQRESLSAWPHADVRHVVHDDRERLTPPPAP